MNRSVIFFGNSNGGKTQLFRQILNGKKPSEFQELPFPTINPEYGAKKLDDQHLVTFIDLSGEEKYEIFFPRYQFKNIKLSIFCVDLSQKIDSAQIRTKIKKLQNLAPKASIIIVGTKLDQSPANFELLKALEIDNIYATLATSAKTGEGIDELDDCIRAFCLRKSPKEKVDEKLKDNKPETPFADAVRKLEQNLSVLPAVKQRAIKKEINQLLEILATKRISLNETAHTKAITDFSGNCQYILGNGYPNILKAVVIVAAAAIVLSITSLVGFGFGMVFGSWLYPSLFINALLSGNTAAVAVAGASIAASGTASALTTYSLFRRPKEMVFIDDFVSELKASMAPI